MKYVYLVPVAIALAGCQHPDNAVTTPTESVAAAIAANSPPHHNPDQRRPEDRLPMEQLAQVRRATARYRDVDQAIADGYKDIDVVLPNMGRHFLKDALVDARFEAERPELLVYSPDQRGGLRLVAVEYAVPLALSDQAPEGFQGAADVWFADQAFQLWTLHAWVWKENPDGVFNPTNKRVP